MSTSVTINASQIGERLPIRCWKFRVESVPEDGESGQRDVKRQRHPPVNGHNKWCFIDSDK